MLIKRGSNIIVNNHSVFKYYDGENLDEDI